MQKLVRLLLDKMRMVKEDAFAVAHVVEEAFAGQSELDDDLVNPQLRQVLYDLQDSKVLDVRRTEGDEGGRSRRHYYWHVRDPSDGDRLPERAVPDPAERLYHRLADEAWARRPAPDE
ncbi:MAG TPA: hypothetical protein VI796_07535 [Candidatus Thermoplasmatota archaeon]|nr:hypothetical protein [Candidatus Thermoplasmatota archaeon]